MKYFRLVLLALAAMSLRAADDARFVMLPLDQVSGKPLVNYAPGAAWASVPQGRQTLGGVPFDVLSKVQLQGNVDARNNRFYPTRVIGIPVQQRLARFHLFHGANLPDQTNRPIASLHLRYADGTTHTILVRYGVHARHWWRENKEEDSVTDTNSSVVWTGRSDDSDRKNTTHRLYKTSFDLPSSTQSIESIDLFTLFGASSPVLLAMTGEVPSAGVKTGPAAPSADDTKYRGDLVIKVSDIADNPVGGARVRGTAVDERSAIVTLARMDDAYTDLGVVPVDFPAGMRELRLTVSAPGHVPADLNLKPLADGSFPREIAVKIEPGVRIGGFVREVDGSPIARAKVEMFRATRDGTGRLSLFKYEENTSDSQGRWRLREAPENLENLLFRVTHTNYQRGDFEFSGDTGAGSLSRNALLTSQAEFKLAPMLRISGTVQDASGRLLPRVEVSLVRTNDSGSTSSTQRRTDARGGFQFTAVDPEATSLLVNSTNFAPVVLGIDPARDTRPIKIVLVPGSPLKGRFFETSEGSTNTRPVAGVMVNVTSASHRLINWRGRTDAEGRFVWEHAPEGLMRISAYGSGFPSRNFTARAGANENVFDLGRVFIWKARAIDADSKAPIAAFSVTPGHQYGGNDDRVNWMSYYTVRSTNGEVILSDRNSPQVVKIEAPGYTPLMMPTPERDSSATNLSFSLRRAIKIKGVVKLPNGQPAAGAEIGAVNEGYLSLGRGAFINHRNADFTNLIVKSDAQGRFEVPPRLSQRLVVVHNEGFAETTQSNLATQAEVTLQPFGTIEGVLMIGSKAAPNSPLHLSESRGGQGLNYDYSTFGGETDSEGKFRYTHVPPGKRWLSRLIATRPNTRSWSHATPVNVESGRTAQAQLGGTGRPVIGTIVADDPTRAIDWTAGYHSIYGRQAPMRFASAAESRAWSSSPAGRAAQDNYRNYAVVFSTNATFRVDDVPPGLYTLQCQFHAPRPAGAPQYGGDGPMVGTLSHQFEIPPMTGDRSDEPFDLGKVEFKVRR
jgi:hypothetical protein